MFLENDQKIAADPSRKEKLTSAQSPTLPSPTLARAAGRLTHQQISVCVAIPENNLVDVGATPCAQLGNQNAGFDSVSPTCFPVIKMAGFDPLPPQTRRSKWPGLSGADT